MCRKMFSFQRQFCSPPWDDGLLIPSNAEALLPLFFFPPSLQCNLPRRYRTNTGCSLLTTREIYRGWLFDGMMSWIKAARSRMYFERSRVPFSQSRVTPFGGNPDLISQSAAREKNINACIYTGAVFHLHSRQQTWMYLAGCFLFPYTMNRV